MLKNTEIDSNIRHEGELAFRAGIPRVANPYVSTLFKQSAWAIGFDKAKRGQYDAGIEINNIRYLLSRLERGEILTGSKGMKMIAGALRSLGYKEAILQADEVIIFLKNKLARRGAA